MILTVDILLLETQLLVYLIFYDKILKIIIIIKKYYIKKL